MSRYVGGLHADGRWWRYEGKKSAAALFAVVGQIRSRQRYQRDMNAWHAQLYGASDLGPSELGFRTRGYFYEPSTTPANLVASAVDTLVAKITKNRPLPQLLTNGGNYAQTKRAKLLSRFVEGELYRTEFWDLRQQIVTDSCIFGTGLMLIMRDPDRPQILLERIFPWELLVDVSDGRYGKPRNIYLWRSYDRSVLEEMYPDHAVAIRNAGSPHNDKDEPLVDIDSTVERIRVVEAWHLPSTAVDPNSDDETDGKHMIAIDSSSDDAVLFEEPWRKDYFPIVPWRKKNSVAGYWGLGLGHELEGWQYELNVTFTKVQESHHLMGGGHILIQAGSDVVESHITNGVGNLIYYSGAPPQWVNPEPVHPQTYQYMKDLPPMGLQFVGISQMSAHSEKPAGIIAAKALQTLDDIETERFMVFARTDEQCIRRATEMILDLAYELGEEEPGYYVNSSFRKSLVKLTWKDVKIDREQVRVEIWPTNLLAKTPAARLQQVQDLFNAGVIDRPMFLKLLDAPDIEAEQDLESSSRQVADEQIEKMLDTDDPENEEEYQMPEPFQDLVYSLHRCQAYYNKARIECVPEANKELLRRYMADCKDLLDKQLAAQAPPPAAPAMGPPGAPPAPTPTPALAPAPGVAA